MEQNEKKNDVKKKMQKRNWMGYCPLACAGSRYRELYHDIRLDRHGLGAPEGATRPSGRARSSSGTPRYGLDEPLHGWPLARAYGKERTRGLAGGVFHNTIVCIMIGGMPSRWVCCDTMSRHGRACATIRPRGARHDLGDCDTTPRSVLGRATTQRAT